MATPQPINPNHPHFEHRDPTHIPVDPDAEVAEQVESEEREPEEDNAPFNKTYVALDGVDVEDISDGDKETLRRKITTFLLRNGYSLEGVRILSDDRNVIEVGTRE